MKKILLIALFIMGFITSSCSNSGNNENEQKITLDQNNICNYFKIYNDIYGDAATLKPCVTLYDLDSDTYVQELSVIMTIEYEIGYYCNRYLSSCDEYNTTTFTAKFSVSDDGELTPLIQGNIDRDSLSNVCSHGINHDTVKILDYEIVSASGYFIAVEWANS